MQRTGLSLIAVVMLMVSSSSHAGDANSNKAGAALLSAAIGAGAGYLIVRPMSQALHEKRGLSTTKSVLATGTVSLIITSCLHSAIEGTFNPVNIALDIACQAATAILSLHEKPVKEIREAEEAAKLAQAKEAAAAELLRRKQTEYFRQR